MLKVLIADDEERICRLIRALVDWDSLGLVIAGVAGNGIEALELVSKLEPDILITDIRMPGCTGLEMISQAKNVSQKLEIIIISGYAHFEYAQTAMKYGVGDYLLKPISKEELTQTLMKLKKRIEQRNISESDVIKLQQTRENDLKKLKSNLIYDLNQNAGISLETMQDEYHMNVEFGVFQAFCLNLDYEKNAFSQAALLVIKEKINTILGNVLKKCSHDYAFDFIDAMGLGLINYPRKKQEEVRKCFRECLNQLETQKVLFGSVDFSMSLGSPVQAAEEIQQSVKECKMLIQNRLTEGTGRVFEGSLKSPKLLNQKLLEKYLRQISHALEVISQEEADQAVLSLQRAACESIEVQGYEIYELVRSAGQLFLTQVECEDRTEEKEQFEKDCMYCRSQEELFHYLKHYQTKCIERMEKMRGDDAVRPIRLAKQYIQNHFSEQITLEQVSDAVGLSAAYFSVLFKKESGEGFAKYLINVRMEEAKILLRETNFSVADICKKVGYNDLKHFVRSFEKMAGVKPGTYRKLYG